MHSITCPTIRSLFKALCFAALVFMTSYWAYKFVIEDEDLCLVDYVALEKADEFPLPTVSMCFRNPFIDEKLKTISPDFNGTTYLQYLKGEIFDDKFNDIDYNNVTFNLSEYLVSDRVYWKNGTYADTTYETDIVKQQYKTFNGIWYGNFIKCFGIEVNNKYKNEIKFITKRYKQNEFLDGINRHEKNIYVLFHYPTQFLLAGENLKSFQQNRISKKSYWLDFTITGMEILQKRDKRRDRCMNDNVNYDNLMLKEHVKNNSCKAPYQRTLEEFPMCSTRQEMEQSLYDMNCLKSNYFPLPCKTISKIDVDHFEFDLNETAESGELLFGFSVVFPSQIKLITQSKAVDINSFIGNIGGYIGLFLGYALIQLPDFISVIYAYLKKAIRKESASILDVSTVTGQCHTGMVSVASLGSDVRASDVDEGTDGSSFKEASTNKLYKVEDLLGTVMEKLDAILQRIDNVEKKSSKYDALISEVNQRLDRQSRRVDRGDHNLNNK